MKKIKTLCCILTLTFLCTGCGTTYQEAVQSQTQDSTHDFANGYFTTITEWDGEYIYRIIYANDSKVKYLIVDTPSHKFGITPLYNSDGTLQIYDGK